MTSNELGVGGELSWEELKGMLNNWKFMDSKKIILIRIPLEYVYALGDEILAEKLHAFYVQNGLRSNGRKQNYVNNKFIIGCYNAETKEIEINPNFEQELTEETKLLLKQGLEEAERKVEYRLSQPFGPITKVGTAEEKLQTIQDAEEISDDEGDGNWNENFWDDLEEE